MQRTIILLLLLAFSIAAFGIGGYAAQTIALSQIVSQPYPGVMVNIVGRGWVQAQIDQSLQIITTTNPPTLRALGGGIGPQGPAGPQGATGPQGPQGVQGIQGIPGTSAPSTPTLPITVAPDGKTIQVFGFSTTGPGPSVLTMTKADGSQCPLAVSATGAVTCN